MIQSFLLALVFLLILPKAAYAVCPVCTVAVAAGLGLSRYLGIDDSITGIWIGGLILSSSFWLSSWLSKKNINIPFKTAVSFIVFYSMVFIPLQLTKIIGHPNNQIFGIDKLFFGSFIGCLLFLVGIGLDKYLRTKNEGKVFFPYQKVVAPVSLLLISSVILYIIKP